MVDVFISYSRTDLPAVTRLAQAVEAEGYDVWWDADLPPHLSYGDVITKKIGAAKAAIVVWSQASAESEWVRAEADMARNQKKLIQTALDNVMPPLPFNQIQFAEIGDWQGESDHPGWRKVKASLAELCGGREPEAVPAPIRVAVAAPAAAAPAPPRPSRWPLYAGLAVGAVGIALATGLLLGQRSGSPEPAASPAAIPAPAASAPAAAEPTAASAPAQVAAGAVPIAQPAAAAPAPASRPAAIASDAPLAAPNAADQLFADSSTRLLQPSEVASLGERQLRIARNEIFARKGMRFTTPMLQQWFGRFAWYQPRYDRVTLNSIERANIETIRQAEARLGQ